MGKKIHDLKVGDKVKCTIPQYNGCVGVVQPFKREDGKDLVRIKFNWRTYEDRFHCSHLEKISPRAPKPRKGKGKAYKAKLWKVKCGVSLVCEGEEFEYTFVSNHDAGIICAILNSNERMIAKLKNGAKR